MARAKTAVSGASQLTTRVINDRIDRSVSRSLVVRSRLPKIIFGPKLITTREPWPCLLPFDTRPIFIAVKFNLSHICFSIFPTIDLPSVRGFTPR